MLLRRQLECSTQITKLAVVVMLASGVQSCFLVDSDPGSSKYSLQGG